MSPIGPGQIRVWGREVRRAISRGAPRSRQARSLESLRAGARENVETENPATRPAATSAATTGAGRHALISLHPTAIRNKAIGAAVVVQMYCRLGLEYPFAYARVKMSGISSSSAISAKAGRENSRSRGRVSTSAQAPAVEIHAGRFVTSQNFTKL